MADSGSKPQYLVSYQLQRVGGDPNEFLVDSVSIQDKLNDCYNIRVQCRIPSARQESDYQACAQRRLKDVELFLRRRFPDGFVLEMGRTDVVARLERFVATWPRIAEREPAVRHVDLRYPNGFALRRTKS